MSWARGIALLVVALMSALGLNIVLTNGIDHGVGLDTFLAGIHDPWQLFINQDLVSGLILTVTWIIYRQRNCAIIDTVAWVWMAIWWGNIVVAAYVILAVAQSCGDPSGFFMGRRSGVALRAVWATPSALMRIGCGVVAAASAAYALHGLLMTRSIVVGAGYVLGLSPIVLAALRLARPAPHQIGSVS